MSATAPVRGVAVCTPAIRRRRTRADVPGAAVTVNPFREDVLKTAAPFRLHHGGELPDLALAWRLAGKLDGPVVLVLGGISATRRVFTYDGSKEGWWNEVVGPGRPLDSDRFAILGLDFVGGSGDSSGPV